MKKYWFKPNSWGWGFVPISVQGFLLIFLLIMTIVFTGLITGMYNIVTFWGLIFYFALLIAEVTGFAYIAKNKTKRRRR